MRTPVNFFECLYAVCGRTDEILHQLRKPQRISGPTAVSLGFVVDYTVYDKVFGNEVGGGYHFVTANNEDEAYEEAEVYLSEHYNDEATFMQINEILADVF